MAHLLSHIGFLLTKGQGSHLDALNGEMKQMTLPASVCCLGLANAQSTLACQGSVTHHSLKMLHCMRILVEPECKVVVDLFAAYERGC